MAMRFPSIISFALFVVMWSVGSAQAAGAEWIEVTGLATATGAQDDESGRRRALADALYQAALMGGADVRGHSAMSKSVMTSDTVIVRAVGRVLDFRVLSQRRVQGTWQVTISARVGVGGDPFCQSPRRLLISAYAPEIAVSPEAPAWTAELAPAIVADLFRQLEKHPSTDVIRMTNRQLPVGTRPEGFDYQVLTAGSVRLAPGELGFVPVVRISSYRDLAGETLALDLELLLHDPNGSLYRQPFQRSVALGKITGLGRVSALTERSRSKVAKLLTQGLSETFDALLKQKACEPVVAQARLRGGKLEVPVGRRIGLTKAAIAFTMDRNATTELLEITQVSANSAVLKPLNPDLSLKAFDGTFVRFVEAAW